MPKSRSARPRWSTVVVDSAVLVLAAFAAEA
jgi:hypothetical protein